MNEKNIDLLFENFKDKNMKKDILIFLKFSENIDFEIFRKVFNVHDNHQILAIQKVTYVVDILFFDIFNKNPYTKRLITTEKQWKQYKVKERKSKLIKLSEQLKYA